MVLKEQLYVPGVEYDGQQVVWQAQEQKTETTAFHSVDSLYLFSTFHNNSWKAVVESDAWVEVKSAFIWLLKWGFESVCSHCDFKHSSFRGAASTLRQKMKAKLILSV